MPMVIPIVAAFAAGAGGVAALGAAAAIGGIAGTIATVAAYATIAGAVLTGVGALTGSKDLMKIGAVLSIGGGIGTLGVGIAGAMSGAESVGGGLSAPGVATNAAEGDVAAVAGDAAAPAASTAGAATAGAAADAGAVAAPVASGTVPEMAPLSQSVAAPATSPSALTSNYDTTLANATGNAGPDTGAGLTGQGGPGTTLQTTTTAPTDVAGASSKALDAVRQGAAGMDKSDLASWWQKAQAGAGAVGSFIEKNPALVKIGGDMLSSMYGPAAEKLDLEKSLMEKARANLNAPIKLTYARP